MATLFKSDGKIEECLPSHGKNFTPTEISLLLGGIGGTIEVIEFETDAGVVSMYHRKDATLNQPLNRMAEAMFQNEFFGNVLEVSESEKPIAQ